MSIATAARIGVGIDTARYGHHATFLREDLQHAARPLRFSESAGGYQSLEDALRRLVDRHDGDAQLHVRVDAAGQYAVNLQAFLRRLDLPIVVSVGEPKRNRDYKNAHFPKRKSDDVDSFACARYAVVERPQPTPEVPPAFDQLRDVAGALDAARKRTTRAVNRLHNQLARVFPELVGEARSLQAKWVLDLLHKYPTAQRLAAARAGSLEKISRVTPPRAGRLRRLAKQSVGALQGPLAERMIRTLVADLRQAQRSETDLAELLDEAYDRLPDGPHRQVQSIGGIGKRTAAALVAKIVSIDRFETPERLVGYFGVFPEERSSGVDPTGNPKAARHMPMSRKGNDLVRGLLWMAAQTALRCNPAVAALYKRRRAAGKRGDVALGHCMRKLLHLVFAVWKTDRPFDPDHYPWESDQPRPRPIQDGQDNGAAGRKGQCPVGKAVTDDAAPTVAQAEPDAKRAEDGSVGETPGPRTHRPGVASRVPTDPDDRRPSDPRLRDDPPRPGRKTD